MPPAWGLADVEAAARARLSDMAYAYAAGGAGEERTLADNVAAFRKHTFHPRSLVDVTKRDLSTTSLGRRYPAPIGIAPTSFHRLFHPDGELGTARAAAERGMLHVVSSLSTTSLEAIAEVGAPRWFQVYVHKDRELTRDVVTRAKAHGYEALVLTVDAPVWGMRDRDRKNTFTLPPPLTLGHFERHLPPGFTGGADGLAAYVNNQLDASLTWDIIPWLADTAGLPVIVKGVLTPDDARLAIAHGAVGVIVSNHGGRQLDRVSSTLDALPGIVAAVDGKGLVMLDGGVRRGMDALIALALGADFVFAGRQVIWGLAAAGEAGVGRVLDLLVEELDNALALNGRRSLAEVDATLIGGRKHDA